ncbi:elongation factor P [Candidatus Gracilibacteria bacterium]|nr:elongation factor P [Candidatus Gracilibacteria bacterium]
MLGITDLKVGQYLVLDNTPYLITFNQFSKSGRQGGVMKTKMKNLLTGSVMERTFQGSDKIEPAEITYKKAQFLYSNGDNFEFMDNDTFEQMIFSRTQLGETIHFLSDGMDCDIQYFNGNPINIQLQPKLTFKIIETEPGIKGNTAGTVTKNATIETGYELKVPPFIEKGEKIVVNTLNGEYIERAK